MNQLNENGFDPEWPSDGDRLFVESNWFLDAHPVRDPAERFYRLPMGYKLAADILIDQAMRSVVDRANVIYPALFCYRQSIELSLKRFVREFGVDGNTGKAAHDLIDLWQRFAEIVNDRGMADSIGLLAAQQLVAEMHLADEKSDGFRYPDRKKDVPFSFGDRGIDLGNLRTVMDSLQNFFECTYMAISYQHDGGMP
jgi:hypothetical protein